MVAEQFQITALLKLQRLLSEGAFTASYRFALLQALIDLAVERGDDSDAALRISITDIGEKFLFYYWRQVLPYIRTRQHDAKAELLASDTVAGHGNVLRQITQGNSVILEIVRDAHRGTAAR